MSKNLKIALTFTLLLCTIFSLCSCMRPALNLEKAADKLEDEGYYVGYDDEASDSNPAFKETLVAYSEDDYIYIVKLNHSKAANLYYEQLQMEQDYKIDSLKLEIETLKFEIKKYGDEYDDDVLEAMENKLEDLEEELKEYKEEYRIGKSGKTVWEGTKTAIKDSK